MPTKTAYTAEEKRVGGGSYVDKRSVGHGLAMIVGISSVHKLKGVNGIPAEQIEREGVELRAHM
jgi:hypothetical protein